jgi:hypothetical protein
MSRRPALLCSTLQAIQWTANAGRLFSRVDHCYVSTEPDAMESQHRGNPSVPGLPQIHLHKTFLNMQILLPIWHWLTADHANSDLSIRPF